MARMFGLRFGIIAAVITLCAMATASAAHRYDDGWGNGMISATAYDNNMIVVSVADYHPAFDLSVMIEPKKIERSYPAYRERRQPARFGRRRARDIDRRLEVRPHSPFGDRLIIAIKLTKARPHPLGLFDSKGYAVAFTSSASAAPPWAFPP